MLPEPGLIRRLLLVIVAASVIIAGGCRADVAVERGTESGAGGTFGQPTTPPTPVAPGIAEGAPAEPPRYSELPPILITELPPEALDTLDLIAAGGPFPFDRDGITFENRERLLPEAPPGHYREYTVVTPGASTRGARRVVAGDAGELFYTDDHYQSFFEIVPED